MANNSNYSNMVATARRRALQTASTYQRVQAQPAPGGAPGYMVHTYTAARWPGHQVGGTGIVVGRLLNPQGQVTAYRCWYNGGVYTMPAGNLQAHGTLFVPRTVAASYGIGNN
jgi:hypothetical protein